jgi:hypothetical protein
VGKGAPSHLLIKTLATILGAIFGILVMPEKIMVRVGVGVRVRVRVRVRIKVAVRVR